ncbi:MAG: flagellar assembly protein FliW [Verrucomicrobiales bacterium]|nr:flagellar assembly protein FliW [Verrucomicrobiales bacterium]|tara:strand:- start:1889 stop:2341 length:453 start_codon:yes stop_codon:yes gene_type:complete
MITIEKKRTEGPVQSPAREGLAPEETGLELHFPAGLLGFEASQHFRLIRDEDLEPYQWMKGLDGEQAFLVIPPGFVVENYNVEISDEDQELLGLENPEDAMVLNIATWHTDETVTVNLKGPIIYNKVTSQARQVIPLNAPDLTLAHPMGN